MQAVGQAIQALLNCARKLRAGCDQVGIGAEQLIGRVLAGFAMVLGEQRQLLVDRAIGGHVRLQLGAGVMFVEGQDAQPVAGAIF